MIPLAVLIFFGSFILIIIGLVLFGIFYKRKPSEIFINPREGTPGKYCTKEPVKCKNKQECLDMCNEVDTIEIDCIEVPRTKLQQGDFGEGGKFCLPVLPKKTCDINNGGVLTYTGYAETDNMEWDCLCMYPGYFGNEGCTDVNAGICNGNDGSFKWDATATNAKAPSIDNCKCPAGTYLLQDKISKSPTCVPSNIFPGYYSDKSIPKCDTTTDCPPSYECKNNECILGNPPGIYLTNHSLYPTINVRAGATTFSSKHPGAYTGPGLTLLAGSLPVGLPTKIKLPYYRTIQDNYVPIAYYFMNIPLTKPKWVGIGSVEEYDSTKTSDIVLAILNNVKRSAPTFWYYSEIVKKNSELKLYNAEHYCPKPCGGIAGIKYHFKSIAKGAFITKNYKLSDFPNNDPSSSAFLISLWPSLDSLLANDTATVAMIVSIYTGKITSIETGITDTNFEGKYYMTTQSPTSDHSVRLHIDQCKSTCLPNTCSLQSNCP